MTASELAWGAGKPEHRFANLDMTFHEAKSELIGRFEREYLERLLERHGGNVSKAAKAAGLDRRSLTRLRERHRPGRNPHGGADEA